MFIDFYELLEISPSATQEEIKVAYRKQCIKWHPDKNINIDTTQRMQDINLAYLILKDEEARNKYDIEYQKFKDYKSENINNNQYKYTNYQFDDNILEKWMQNAEKQAKQMVKDTIDEFQGASAEAGSSIMSYLLGTMIPMLVGYLLFKACANSL